MLRSGNSYSSKERLKMSPHEEEVTREVEADATEGSEENRVRFSSYLVDGMIKASLEHLHAQISALNELMDRLIQSNSAKETTTVCSREIIHQYESPYSGLP